MKTIVVLLLSLLVSQQVLALEQQDGFRMEARGLKDQFIKIVEGLLSLIQSILNQILGEVDKAIQKIQDLILAGVNLVEYTINQALEVINALEKKALDLGVDITECVFENKQLIINLKDKTIQKLEDNAARIVGGLISIKDEAVGTINKYFDMVFTLLDDFGKCSIINIICMTKVIAKATATSIELTVQLPLVAARIIKTIAEVTILGVADINNITAEFTTTSARLLWEVTTCVAEKGITI